MNRRLWTALAIVSVPLVLFPLVSAAGGLPRFPTREECVRPAPRGSTQPLEIVYVRSDSPEDAEQMLAEVVHFGFVGTEVVPDGCGRWKVRYDGVPSYEVALEVMNEARSVGLDPRIEIRES